ncbi:hypothetical protein FA95DRAFT_1554589 [Auriscalpium vulgare]|uniref:Uncharacterized protein n=1 Tax=Auriscalpium vulgare TaxID=40419 RepID=A0ACB8S6H2_9AGAM|nr:hypothetical protein FA95DRAFT_1554589 [Auriscalpium vulgare]
MFGKTLLLLTACLAVQAASIPAKRQNNNGTAAHPNVTDPDVLNFALTLEHLENAFYTGGLQNFSQAAFLKAGYAASVRGYYQQIASHEQTHVANLTSLLGTQAVQPCTYNFGNGNVSTFVATSDMLEVVGASAYSGSARYLQNKDLLTAAAAILATEARQSSWINSAVRGGNPWSTAYETPLDLNQVFTLASSVIVSCPSNNTAIPVTPNPPLTATPATANPGQNITLTFNTTSGPVTNATGLYAAFLSGVTPTFLPLSGNGTFSVTIPSFLRGFVFLAITNSSSAADDSVTVAGPAFFNFAFNSNNTITPLPR